MTRTISLVAILVLAGLALVPAALGNHQYGDAVAGTQQPDFWNYDQQTDAKIADTSPGVAPRDLATLYSAEGSGRAAPVASPDVVDRAVAAARRAAMRAENMLIARERALDARLEADRTASPIDVGEPTTSTGRGFEWLQIGMGLGAGIALAFSLFLGLQLMRVRPPAY